MVNSDDDSTSHKRRSFQRREKAFYTFLSVAVLYILVNGLVATVTRNTPPEKRLENEQWIASSHYWTDRGLCRWLGCCGTFHMLNHAGWTSQNDRPAPARDFSGFWQSGRQHGSTPDVKERTIPDYVFDYAPYIHLSSSEQYWPSDIAEHLAHVTPYLNHSQIFQLDDDLDLGNIIDLNALPGGTHGKDIFLHSNDNMESFPPWLSSSYNIPPHTEYPCQAVPQETSLNGRCGLECNVTCRESSFGSCCSIHGFCGSSEDYCGGDCNPLWGDCHGPVMTGRYGPRIDLKKREEYFVTPGTGLPYSGGRSGAPAILIVVPKDKGVVDAFWFCFYSYNLGKRVLGIRFGDHVGDWEHTMVRFKHGVPTEMFLSAHSWGSAYTYDALEKYYPDPQKPDIMLSSWTNATQPVPWKRPVVYSAEGSHAMYPTPDYHSYVAPFGILHDDTDKGPLWDPAKNVKSFMYDIKTDELHSSTLNPDAPTGWFRYAGHWGDRYYLLSDPRQYRFMGEYHYVNGPLGPKFKDLAREHSCIIPGDCKVHGEVRTAHGDVHVLHEEHEAKEDGD